MRDSDGVKLGKRIRDLREQAGLSQEELARRLHVARPTVSQIEAGARRLCAAELMRLSETFHVTVDALLYLAPEPVVTVRDAPRRVARPSVRINVPQRNLAKFREVLLYVLNRVGSLPNVGETVIYKLLYFMDFDYYEQYEEQLIGATYIRNRYGPTPVEFRKVIADMVKRHELTEVQNKYFRYPQRKYLPLRKPDLTQLKASEIRVIDDVLNRLAGMNAKQVSDYSHNDVPWLTTEEGKAIEYEAVFYRTAPYSVRRYDQDVSGG